MRNTSIAGKHNLVRKSSASVGGRGWQMGPLGAVSIGTALLLGVSALSVWWVKQGSQSSKSSANTVLARLARVEPPAYSGGMLEISDPEAAVLLGEALAFYSRGEYHTAISRLSALGGEQRTATPALYFLGASYLLSGDPAQAITILRGLTASGDSQYQGQARYLIAKSYLQMNDAENARSELRQAVAERGAQWGEAAELLAALNQLSTQASPSH